MVVRHRVREHVRRRSPVSSYVRGNGSKVTPFRGTYSGNPHLSKKPMVKVGDKFKPTVPNIRQQTYVVTEVNQYKTISGNATIDVVLTGQEVKGHFTIDARNLSRDFVKVPSSKFSFRSSFSSEPNRVYE